MLKFNRNYKITIKSKDWSNDIIIEYPISINFDIVKNFSSTTTNELTLNIRNLSPHTSNMIAQDFYEVSNKKLLILQAGYGNELSTIFVGDIRQAYVFKTQGEGVVDTVTYINSFDGSVAKFSTYSNITYARGSDIKDITEYLVNDLIHRDIERGVIDIEGRQLNKSLTIEGSTFEQLNLLTNGGANIDNNKINVLGSKSVIINSAIVGIDSDTGLIGTPRRLQNKLFCETIFEPRLQLNQLLTIKSKVQTAYNGEFKVIGLKHSGSISPVISGECKTQIELLIGQSEFKTLYQ